MTVDVSSTTTTPNAANAVPQGDAPHFASQQQQQHIVQHEQQHPQHDGDQQQSPLVGHGQGHAPAHQQQQFYQYGRVPASMDSPQLGHPQYHQHQHHMQLPPTYGPPTPQHTPIHLTNGSSNHGHQQQHPPQHQQLVDMQSYQQHQQHQQQQQHQYQHQVYAAASPILSHPGTPNPQPRPYTPNNLPLTAPGSAANSPAPPAPVAVGTPAPGPMDLPYNNAGMATGPPSIAPSPAMGPGSHMGTPQQQPTTLAAAVASAPMQQMGNLSLTEQLSHLHFFLATAPTNWQPHERIRRFLLPSGEHVSCVLHNNLFHITGTDIVRALLFRFQAIGRPVRNLKKFEEGIFSDLRNLKPGVDASLETNRSEFLEWLYKHNCVRTQKKQKVFYWFSVPWDQLFYDALERDLKREALGMEPTSVPVAMPPPEMPTVAGNPLLRQHFEQQHLHQQQLELQRQQQLEIQNRRVQTQGAGGSSASVGTSSPSLPGSPAVPGSRPRTPQVGPGATAAAASMNGNLRQHVVLAAAAAQSPYMGPGSAVQSPMVGPGSFQGTPQQSVMYPPQMQQQQHMDHGNSAAAGSPLVGHATTLAMPPPPPPVSNVTSQDTMAFGSGGHPNMPLLAQGLAISTVPQHHPHQQQQHSNMASPVTSMPVSAAGTPLLPHRNMSGSELPHQHHPGRILISGLIDPMSQQSTPVVGTPMDLSAVSSPFVSQPHVLMTPTDAHTPMLSAPVMTATPDRGVQSVDPQQLSPFGSAADAQQQTPLMGTVSTPTHQQAMFSPPPAVNGALAQVSSTSLSPPPVTSGPSAAASSSSVFMSGEDPFKDLHFAWDDTAVDYMLHANQHTHPPTTSALSAALLVDANPAAAARANAGNNSLDRDPLRSVLGGGLSKKRRNSTLLKTFSRRLSLSKELIDLYQIADSNSQASSGLDLHSSVPIPHDIAMTFQARTSGLAAAAGMSDAAANGSAAAGSGADASNSL